MARIKYLLILALLIFPGIASAGVVTWSAGSGLSPEQIGLPYSLSLGGRGFRADAQCRRIDDRHRSFCG